MSLFFYAVSQSLLDTHACGVRFSVRAHACVSRSQIPSAGAHSSERCRGIVPPVTREWSRVVACVVALR